MYMYHHLISSEIKESRLGYYIESLRIVSRNIIVTFKSKKHIDINVRVVGKSVNDILEQFNVKAEVLSKFYK